MTEHTPEFTQSQLPFPQTGPNPSGLCMCGCGQKTNLAPQSNTKRGDVIGQPLRFIKGHDRLVGVPEVAPNPGGLCMCGCGQKTNLAPASNSKTGDVRGQPLRYIRSHGHQRNTPETALWKNVTPGAVDECWLWQGTRYPSGYGQAQIRKQRLGAHRLSWQLHYGEIPDGLWVLHKCDTPLCVNPAHLFLGTPKDNTQDMIAKDRNRVTREAPRNTRRGERSNLAKANESQVRIIRVRFAAGETISAIARDIGLNRSTVKHIAHRKTWKHVE